MRDVMTAAGVLLVLGTPARYVGTLLLRAAAFAWFVFAGVGLLLAGGERSESVGAGGLRRPGRRLLGRRARGAPSAPGMVGHPNGRARVLRTPAAPPARAARAPERGRTARPAALNRPCGDLSPRASDDASPSALAPTAHTV
jgi:hypothetical protein